MVGFSSLYQKGLSKIHVLEKLRSLEIGNSSKKGQKQMGEKSTEWGEEWFL